LKLAQRLEEEDKMAKKALPAIIRSLALILSLGLMTTCTRNGGSGVGCTDHGCWKNIGNDVRITSDPKMSELPSLFWSGSEYGVSWQDNRDGNWEIYFARISGAGTKIGADLRITNDANDSLYPSLVWSGSEYGVSWDDTRNGNHDIYFARISANGTKIGSDVRITNNANHNSWYPSLRWSGSEYGVSWNDTRDGNNAIYLALISDTGTKIGSDFRIMSDPLIKESFSLIWTGSEYGVTWNDAGHGAWDIHFPLSSASGTKIRSDVRITSDPNRSRFPSLAWTGSEYGVSWDDWRENNDEIFFARIGLVP
jgi:hypothetical protein